MSWLIESYLEEGKHGPDHPESLNMKNMEDMRKKKEKENEEKENNSSSYDTLVFDASGKKYNNMHDKINASKDADIAGKKAILKGSDYDKAKEDYIRNKINKAEDKIARNRKILDDYAETHRDSRYAPRPKLPASVVRSIRRNEEKNEKRSNNECAWIVESLQ
jgi:hypothetical protein